MEPENDQLGVPDSLVVLELYGEGSIQFYCVPGENGGPNTLKTNHGEAYADVRSPDNVWVGTFEYPLDGLFMGQPTWSVKNQITGEVRTIHGNNQNDVKVPSPEGYEMDWTRRIMWGDESTLDRIATPEEIADDTVPKLVRGYDNATIIPAGPKTRYVVRTETYAGEKPKEEECVGAAGDFWVPFKAKYTMLSCDQWLLQYANYLPPQFPGGEPYIRNAPPQTTSPPPATLPPLPPPTTSPPQTPLPTTLSPTQAPEETPTPFDSTLEPIKAETNVPATIEETLRVEEDRETLQPSLDNAETQQSNGAPRPHVVGASMMLFVVSMIFMA